MVRGVLRVKKGVTLICTLSFRSIGESRYKLITQPVWFRGIVKAKLDLFHGN